MIEPKLDIAVWNYDRTQLLRDGTVAINGANAAFHSGRIVTDIFKRMVADRAYDVSELGMTYFLRTFDDEGRSPFVAIPVFPVRSFRHGAIYIHKASGIETAQDLVGKRIGELALYGHDAGVMPKGILSDEYGVKPEQSRWLVGGIDFPLDPVDFVPRPVPPGVEVEWAGKDVDLGDMLVSGEIDALISADVPKSVLEKNPKVGRLFEDYQAVERAYYRRTGIFPIMHAVVVTREVADHRPELVKAVYQGFCAAKDKMQAQYVAGMTFNNMTTMLPWLTNLIEHDRDLLGDDWWPYGIERNRAAIDAILRYHHEQGLTKRRFTIEDVFFPGLLDTWALEEHNAKAKHRSGRCRSAARLSRETRRVASILVFYGSYRADRLGIRLANYLVAQFAARQHAAELIDAQAVGLPMLDRMYKEHASGTAPPAMEALAVKIRAADAFVFVTGEYNWGVQPGLKNLTDHFLEEWFWRPAAIASYSAGRLGGARAGSAWHATLAEMGMVVVSSTLTVGTIAQALDAVGTPTGTAGAALEKAYPRFADDLAWWTEAAQQQRALAAPPY